MIVAKRKPLKEIQDGLGSAERVLVVGCGTCVAVCLAGGEKEAGVLASQLRLSAGTAGRKIQVDQATLERQCDREFLAQLERTIDGYEAVVSLACGAGVQFLAEAYPGRRVLPGVEHHLYRRGRGSRALDRTLPGLRSMFGRPDRRNLSQHHVRQRAAQRPLRRNTGRPL